MTRKEQIKSAYKLTGSNLKPAIHIYEKYGFKEITLDYYEYERVTSLLKDGYER